MQNKNRTGFTLLEVLIAIGILAVGLVSVFSLFPIGIYAVKDTVEDTRAGGLAGTARAEMTLRRADMRILDNGASYYDNAPQYVPFGPWRYPGNVDVFRNLLYESFNAGANFRRVLFDDRTMVPIRLKGTFDNGNSWVAVNFDGLTRDADRLEQYYDAAGSTFAPYEIYLRVYIAGTGYRDFQITDRTYWNAGAPPSEELETLTLSPAPPLTISGLTDFEVLLPVATREPPVDLPQAWTGGIADFDNATATGAVYSDSGNRNLAAYFCQAAGAVPGGWISVDSDWFQINTVTRVAGIPTSFTLVSAGPTPVPPDTTYPKEFDILLPVVNFTASVAGNEEILMVADDTVATGGGGPQLGQLEGGASIEIILDGAKATFDPFPAGTTIVTITPNTLNPATSGFITAGNFIRINGRDYEIATNLAAGPPPTFTIIGAVPYLGADKYFNIVIGYDPNPGLVPPQVPMVARFPVVRVSRSVVDALTGATAVTSFVVGRDTNGNLPADLGMGAATETNPVHILPRNHSQFAYEVVLAQKSLTGEFSNVTVVVNAPQLTVATPQSPAMGPVSFPPTIRNDVANESSSIYQLSLLRDPTSAGLMFGPTGIQATAGDGSSLTLTGAPPPFIGAKQFNLFDKNSFMALTTAGTGTYVPGLPARIDFPLGSTLTADAVFMGPGMQLYIPEDPVGFYQVASISPQCDSITVVGFSSFVVNTSVTVQMQRASGVGVLGSAPHGRGRFKQGSNVVMAVYADQLSGAVATPTGWKGLPYKDSAADRQYLAVGDYIRVNQPGTKWYAVKAIIDNDNAALPTSSYDCIVLDRPFEGPDYADIDFVYETPSPELYQAQVAVFRNYSIHTLREIDTSRDEAAAFGFDANSDGTVDDDEARMVYLAAPLPPEFKPGDYIRADGDADHSALHPRDAGLGDAIDGDSRWYMIDIVSDDRFEITLVSPYRGYMPAAETWQPASVSGAIIRTFDTVIGAF